MCIMRCRAVRVLYWKFWSSCAVDAPAASSRTVCARRTITVHMGGTVDEGDKFIAPTIVSATPASKVMRDEIFGPILPILTYSTLNEAIEYINEHDKPLALYVFSDTRCVLRLLLLVYRTRNA